MSWTARILLAAAFLVSAMGAASAQTKRALIVGVGAYDELNSLQKTHGDANGYAAVFRDGLGFDTVELLDPDRATFSEAFGNFLQRIEPGDEVVFIFSGHGWSDGSENFLVMSDAPHEASEYRLKQETFALSSSILADLRARNPDLVLAIIDACRDNPFDAGTRSGFSRGLARIDSQRGSMVMFAADAGETALDRLGTDDASPYSVFTRTLLPKLSDPSLSLQEIAVSVKSEVSGLARSVHHDQLPTYYDGLSDRQCLQGACAPRAPPAPATTPDTDAWLQITQQTKTDENRAEICASYRSFIDRYPDSVYTPHARKFADSSECAGEGQAETLPTSDPAASPAPETGMRLAEGFYRTKLITYDASNDPRESLLAGRPGICWKSGGDDSLVTFLKGMMETQGWTGCEISNLASAMHDARSTQYRFACKAAGLPITGFGAMTDDSEAFDLSAVEGDWIKVDDETVRGTWRIVGYHDGNGDCGG